MLMVSYAHEAEPKGARFKQAASDPLPVWAVDVCPYEVEYPEEEDEFKVSKKLATISLAMSDAFHFVHIRALLEDWDRMAMAGDPKAREAIVAFEQFHALCNYVLTKGK